MADDQSGFDVWKYAQEGAQARQTQAATQIAQEQAQREKQKYAQEQVDKLHGQIGAALEDASDASHYNQILGALKQFNMPVSEYELAPDGSDFEAKRTAALARIGQVRGAKAAAMDLATKRASLYGDPVKGTMTPPGAPGAPGTPPVAPATPPFGTPPLGPSSPGMTTPTMNPGTGQMEAMPQSGTPPVMPPPGAGMPPMQGAQNPLIQAATTAGQSAPPPPPVSREAAPTPAPETRQGQLYVPKMPGMPIRFEPYPAGFSPTESDSDTAEIKNEREYQKSIYEQYKDAGLKEKPSLAETKQIMSQQNRGVIYGVKDGKLQPTGDVVPGSTADTSMWGNEIKEKKLEQPGGGNKPPAHVGEVNEFRKSILEDPNFSDEAKKKFTYAAAERIYDSNKRGEELAENENHEIRPSGIVVAGGKQYAEEAKNKIAQQRADTAEALKDLKDPGEIANRLKEDYPTAENINSSNALGFRNMLNRGGILETDKRGNLVVTGGYKGSQIDNFDRRMKFYNDKLDLDKNKFDFKKEIANKNYDLAAQKLSWTKEKDSIEHQASLARVRAAANADAKAIPRITSGYTLMGHIKTLNDDLSSMSEADANKAIGWINSHGTVQDLRNELTYIMGNKEQYLANNPQAASYIKVAMGLASLGAEIDRPYLGGMGPVAEETRKRLDSVLDGLKKAPNVAVLKSGLQCLKGYVNEIIDTALPSAIINDKSMQAERAKSLAENEKFRHETGVDIRGNGIDPAKISQPVFRSDDADLKKHITEQIANGALKSGDVIHIKNPDGTIAEHKVK